MVDTARVRFDELVAEVTNPPAHGQDFDARLSTGLYEVDRKRGAVRSRPRRRRGVILLAAALIGLAAVVLAAILGGSSSAPTPAELQQIGAVIERWEKADLLPPWPPEHYAREDLPREVHERMAARRSAVARAVGTDDFFRSADEGNDPAAGLESFRRAEDTILVDSETEVLDVSYCRTELIGDVVVRVTVWQGETTAFWDRDEGRLIKRHKTDGTPVYEYTVRRADGGWRIVSVRQVEISSDASGAQYGPSTPHDQQPIPSRDGSL